MYTVQEVANWQGVSSQTVYRNLRDYHHFMSPAALMGKGQTLTTDDAKTLTFIFLMRLEGRTRAAITKMLHEGKRGDLPLSAQSKSNEDKDAQITQLRAFIIELRDEADGLLSQLRSAKGEAASQRQKREDAEKALAANQALLGRAEEEVKSLNATLMALYLKNGGIIPPQSPVRPPSKK